MMFPVFPLLLLITALGSIYLYQRFSNEVYRVLVASLAIVCLIWGFAVAHWSIHLLCLVFLLMPNKLSFILRKVSVNQ